MNLSNVILLATETQAITEPDELKLSLLDLSVKGGWIMLVLAIFSVVSLYIFIERYITINKASKNDDSFMNTIRTYMIDGNLNEAKTICQREATPISRMIGKGLSRIGKPLNDIQTAIENVGSQEVAKLEKGLPFLSTIAGVATMLGFLGTVVGMIQAFWDMANAGNNIDIQLLSTGIYQAMVTTVGGLVVGIMAYFFYNILVAKIDKVVNLLEAKSTEFMDVLNEPAK